MNMNEIIKIIVFLSSLRQKKTFTDDEMIQRCNLEKLWEERTDYVIVSEMHWGFITLFIMST